MKKIIRKVAAITIAFAVAFTTFPIATSSFSADAYAATAKKITLRASASGQHGASLSWNKIKKPGKGYAVFRDGYVIAHVGKRYSFSDSGLAAATAYTYKVKAYKTKVKKTKMWYNKATGQYQKKKPAKRYRGKRKTFKKVTYKYSKVSNAVSIRTAAPPASAVTVPVPQNLSVTVDGTDLKISWSPVEGATGYKVYVDSYTFDADTTLASDGMKKKKITGVTAGTHTVQVAAVKGSAISAKSNKVTATVSAPGEERKEVTDYLGETRWITKKTDQNGNVYWNTDNNVAYMENEMAMIDRTVAGEFDTGGGVIMVQTGGSDSATFYKRELYGNQSEGIRLETTTQATVYDADREYGIRMFGGDPAKLTYEVDHDIVSVDTWAQNPGVMQYRPLVKNYIASASGSSYLHRVLQMEVGKLKPANGTMQYGFVCFLVGPDRDRGCGFENDQITITIKYNGKKIGEISWKPSETTVNGMTPNRALAYDIAMQAIEANGGKKDYYTDMRWIQQWFHNKYNYDDVLTGDGGAELLAGCEGGAFVLETYSVMEYGVFGFSGYGSKDPEEETHTSFNLNSDPSTYFETQGHR